MTELITTSITTVITAFVTFFFTRRKYLSEVKKAETETDSSEIDNVEKAIRIWRQLSEDIRNRLTKDVEELRLENQSICVKLDNLARENQSLRSQMAHLRNEISICKMEKEKLMRKFKDKNPSTEPGDHPELRTNHGTKNQEQRTKNKEPRTKNK